MTRSHDEGLNGSIAAVLRDERLSAGLTIEQLAERSGVPVVTVQRLLAARRAITMAVFDDLCHGLGLSPDDVMITARKRLRADPELVARVLAGIQPKTRASKRGESMATHESNSASR